KQEARDLAVFGGRPLFPTPLCVGAPNVGDRRQLLRRIEGALDRRALPNHGPPVPSFEREAARAAGVRHCVETCSTTTGLRSAARALGLTGEVIVPAFTFVGTAHALEWVGALPVFADIRADTHTLDPAAVERLVTPQTTGVLGVHLWGRPCDV